MELLKNLEGLSADEQMTAVVELQKAAMKHLEEQKQASIGKSAELVIQGLKKIKSDFEAKFDSLNYDIQTKVASLKDGEQGLQGPKGDQGERGLDGSNGRDGRDGKDGKDGVDGVDGVGVRDAKIDFDGSLVISLTDGREINCGEVVSVDVAKQIQKVTHNIQTGAGGDSQTVLDAIAALQATIATYGTMATQNANNVAITGGAINNTTIGATTPSTGVFTTLTSNSTAQFGRGSANYLQAVGGATTVSPVFSAQGSDTNIDLNLTTKGTGVLNLNTGAGTQVRIIDSGSTAVNRIHLQGQGTGFLPIIASRGSDTNLGMSYSTQGTGGHDFYTAGTNFTQQVKIAHTASAVNYVQVTGSATGGIPRISTQGSDSAASLAVTAKSGTIWLETASGFGMVGVNHTAGANNYLALTGGANNPPVISAASGFNSNVPLLFQSKGTGAIDLAAGSSGVNISNGGTVTALTRTSGGSAYTGFPSIAISAPTTAGGVQATATVTQLGVNNATVQSGGTGYTNGDVLTIVGGTPAATTPKLTVTGVSGGVITSVSVDFQTYTAIPTSPVSVTGGTGSSATFNLTYFVPSGIFSITNAGSGYVEQPTVTFSGGGGSGAAAYATVGSNVPVKSLGNSIDFYVPEGIGFRVSGSSSSGGAYWMSFAGSTTPILRAIGSTSGVIETNSAVPIQLRTSGIEQLRVSHTASAVNYVQVTGAATGSSPNISSQGSDSFIGLQLQSKTAPIIFITRSGQGRSFNIADSNAPVNYLQVQGNTTGVAPILSAQGSDTNIDLTLTPKGTGRVKFGTYTANMALTIQGYIEILDSGGTIRKLAVIA